MTYIRPVPRRSPGERAVKALMFAVAICLLWAVSPILVFVAGIAYVALGRP